MALKSTSISKNGSKGHHGFVLTVYEDSINESSNTSSISFKLELYNLTNGGWDWNGWNTAIMAYVNINGNNFSNSIPSYGGSGYKTVVSGNGITVAHNDSSGEASISFSFEITENSYAAAASYTCGTAKNSGSMTLTTIPRYTTASVAIANDYQERTLNFSYTIGHECSSVKYYVNNTEYKASGLTAGTHSISLSSRTTPSIAAGTKYSIYVKATRKSSGKVTTSNTEEVTTYSYPYIKSISPTKYYIGQTGKLSVDVYNPLKRSITVYMKKTNASGSLIVSKVIATNGLTDLEPTEDKLYTTIGTGTKATMAVYCTYGSTSTSGLKTGTYYTVENLAKPNFDNGAVTWEDAASYNFTKVKTTLVQNKGLLKIKLTTGATAKTGAGTITYTATCGSQTLSGLTVGTAKQFSSVFNISSSADLIVTATDQRGYSTSKKLATIPFFPYSVPAITATAYRQNNYENTCFFIASASSSPCGGNNKVTAFNLSYTLNGSKKTQAIGTANQQTISVGETQITNSLPNSNSYDVVFAATDTMGNSHNITVTIPKGVPIFFIDTKNLAAGVNCFPSAKGFEVDGTIKGSGSVTATKGYFTDTYKEINGGNTNNYPWHRIATVSIGTGSWLDRDCIIEIRHKYNGGGYGRAKIGLRTNNATNGDPAHSSIIWLERKGIPKNSLAIAHWGVSGNNVYADVYYKVPGSYPRASVHQIDETMLYTLITSIEKDNTTTSDKKGSTEVYKDIATAATELRGQAYTAVNYAVDNNTFLLDTVYPKGSIYMSTENVSPASFLGGTWNPINNVFLLAQGSSYSAGGTGGEATVGLAEANLPGHTHKIPVLSGSASHVGDHSHTVTDRTTSYGKGAQSGWRCLSWSGTSHDYWDTVSSWGAGGHSHTISTNESKTGSTGSGTKHNNMPPYLVVYMWKRTA